MTPEEIVSLAGRALDVAVAEHVMGWKRATHRGRPVRGIWERPDGVQVGVLSVPPYSTDLASAIEVAIHLRNEGHDVYLVARPRSYARSSYVSSYVSIGHGPDAPRVLFGAARELPEAICRAALLAVEAAMEGADHD